MTANQAFLVLFLVALSGAVACTTPLLEKAFKPGMETVESDKIIGEYCVSCHVHKSFDSASHVETAKKSYTDADYAVATNCRVCHTYKRTWLLDERRGTHWPGNS